jgi:glycosyltransferase involved in cell wall biosynthesis
MRVLHVIPSLSAVHGGPTRALGLMEQVLAARGVQVDTATSDDDGLRRRNGKPCGVPLAENGVTRRYFRKWLDFYKVAPGLAWWLVRQVRGYDVVHIHALFSFSSVVAAWAARWAGVPYVLRPLGTLSHYGVTRRRPWLKRLSLALLEGPALRHAAAVHFTSEDEQREAAQCGLPLRGVVIPLGIEAAAPGDPAVVRRQFPQLADAPYLLFLSRLDPKKNVEGLLRAFGLCAAQWPDLKLLVAGTGEAGYVVGLRALADQLGLSGRVVWAGHVEGAIKAGALAGAEAFVLPSFSENFGIAAAEALMAGKPCILGQGVAIAQEVASAGAGLAVAPEPVSIAAAVAQVMGDAPGRAIMAQRAAALARARYSAEAMGANLVRLYSGILKT